jgi:lipoprotein-releasing system permease protein
MPFEWFVALRYLREGRAQTGLILAAVAVGVSVIVFLSALINGLQTSLVKQTLGAQPHVTLRPLEETPRPAPSPGVAVARLTEKTSPRLRSIDQWPLVLASLERVPGVLAASPTVIGPGFAERGAARRPIVIRGIDAERFSAVIDLRSRMERGRFDVSGSNVVIGTELAGNLGVSTGDKIRVATPEGIDDLVTVAGVFDLGNKPVNQTWVLTSLRQAQSLYALPGGATAVEVKVAQVFEAERVAVDIQDRTGLPADSWMKLNAQLLVGLRSQDSSKTLIQFFVVVAVALGIASVLIVSVVQKSKEIGILRAYGTPARRILVLFLIQGGMVGLLGSFVGSGLGALFSLGFERLARNADGSPTVPVQLDLELFVSASLLAVGIGLLSAAVPAWRASRLDPATAIRHG